MSLHPPTPVTMTAAEAMGRWLGLTRDLYSTGEFHRQAQMTAIGNFLDSKSLGPELDRFLRQLHLVERLRAAGVPSGELAKALREVYAERLRAVEAGDLESYVHEMVTQDGLEGALNTFGALEEAYKAAPRKFVVEWEVRFADSDNLISEGDHEVSARTRWEAEQITRKWVEMNDPGFDDRVDPYVLIRDVIDPAEEGEDDGAEEDGDG